MKKEDIISLPNPHLRHRSEKIREINDDVVQLVTDMIAAAIDWENSRPHEISAALAAVQVDHLKRVVIVRTNFEDKADKDFTALINPEIVKREGEIIADFEGCLSVPDVYGKVPRHNKVRIRAVDVEGNEVRFKADGFLARVLQHEIDHCNGVCFIDHIRSDKTAFYELDDKGELQPLDYHKNVENNHDLWVNYEN